MKSLNKVQVNYLSSDELIQEKAEFKKGLSALAMNLNNTSKFKDNYIY